MDSELEIALGTTAASFNRNQSEVLDKAVEADRKQLLGTVEWALAHAEQPAGVIYNKAKEIVRIADRAALLRDQAGAELTGKKTRSALNYSQTALGQVPMDEQEQHLREEFPWIPQALLDECLTLGSISSAEYVLDEARVVLEAQARKENPAP